MTFEYHLSGARLPAWGGQGPFLREEKVALAICGNEKPRRLRAVQESAAENPVKPFDLKDELAVCHRHECLRVPACAASQLGLSVLTRTPPDQCFWRVQTRTKLFPPGSRFQQDSRSGGLELLSELQLSQQLLSAAEEWGERWHVANIFLTVVRFDTGQEQSWVMILGLFHACATRIFAVLAGYSEPPWSFFNWDDVTFALLVVFFGKTLLFFVCPICI